VAGEKQLAARRIQRAGEEGVTGPPGGGLTRFGGLPVQGLVREPKTFAERRDCGRLGSRGAPEAVIYREDDQRRAGPCCPLMGQPQEGDGIASAGYGQSDGARAQAGGYGLKGGGETGREV
jgi:hypothetical protein